MRDFKVSTGLFISLEGQLANSDYSVCKPIHQLVSLHRPLQTMSWPGKTTLYSNTRSQSRWNRGTVDTANRNAVIIGPADTPFEDGTFRLVMQFEEQYPNKPPIVKFISKMFHPNVYATGELCLDILQNRWSPTYDVAAVLTSIQSYVLPTWKIKAIYWQDVGFLTIQIPARPPTSRPRIFIRITGRSI